jgi:TolB protein
MFGAAALALLALVLSGCSLLQPEQPEYRYWEPVLSPDGTHIAYSSPVGEAFELFVQELASGDESHLTSNGYVNWGPSWSPDGTQVVFVSQRDENIDLYVVDVAGGEETRLTTHEKEDVNPHWGVDGRVLFNSSRTESWELYAVDPVTLTVQRLSSATTQP